MWFQICFWWCWKTHRFVLMLKNTDSDVKTYRFWHSDGPELGEFVRTARNTYTNSGSVVQFDFHQSDKSNVTLPSISFLSSNELMETVLGGIGKRHHLVRKR
jgi:hypothetical protein